MSDAVSDPRTYLGLRLKDQPVLDLLEDTDGRIWYDIDLTHENIPDIYWIELKPHGVCLRADEHQIITTIFVYLTGQAGYAAFTGTMPGLDIVGDRIPVLGEPTRCGAADDTTWVRYDAPTRSVHLQSRRGRPLMLTFMVPFVVPGAPLTGVG